MLRIIYGADTFTAHEVLRHVLSAGGSYCTENVEWMDGRTATPREILQSCEQSSMFAETRQVVVEGLLARFSKDDSGKRPAKTKKRGQKTRDMGEWEPFVERVPGLPATSTLVLLDADLKAMNPLLKALLPLGEVTQCEPLKRDALPRWVRERVAAGGGRIEEGAAQRLASLVGADLWQLTSEIEKLVVYANGAPIRSDMVDNLAASGLTPSIFMLVDAIVERNQQLARRRLDDMYDKGLSAGYVLTMVARQFRLLAQIHEARGRRDSPPSSRELSGLQPFALTRATQQASRYKEVQVQQAFQRVLEADRAIKSGVYTDRMALEMLITELLRIAA